MAKNKKDIFKNNLSVQKPTDNRIEQVAEDITQSSSQEEEYKGVHIKFPRHAYDKLNAVKKKTGIPQKYIIMQALQEYYEKHNY